MVQNCIKIRKQNESDTRVRKMCPRKEAQYISWDLIAASCPHYRSYCLHLSKAPSVTGSLHPVTSPSHSNPTKKHNTDTDWGCADFKMRRNRSTGRRSVRGFCTADVQYRVRTLIRSAFLLADNVAWETSDLAQQTRAQHPFGLASETLRNRARTLELNCSGACKAFEVKSHLHQANLNQADLHIPDLFITVFD